MPLKSVPPGGETLTRYKILVPAQGIALASILLVDSEETLPRRFGLNDAGLLITADFSALLNQSSCPS